MNVNIKPSDRGTLLGRITPQSATTAKSTGWVSMATLGSALATVMVGTISSSGTVDAKIEQATDGSGSNAKDVSGLAITQLTQAGTDSDKDVEINVQPTDLDRANNFTHIRLTITPATAAALIAGTIRGFSSRYQPATDATTVDEVVG
jgi:hypothetical protein